MTDMQEVTHEDHVNKWVPDFHMDSTGVIQVTAPSGIIVNGDTLAQPTTFGMATSIMDLCLYLHPTILYTSGVSFAIAKNMDRMEKGMVIASTFGSISYLQSITPPKYKKAFAIGGVVTAILGTMKFAYDVYQH